MEAGGVDKLKKKGNEKGAGLTKEANIDPTIRLWEKEEEVAQPSSEIKRQCPTSTFNKGGERKYLTSKALPPFRVDEIEIRKGRWAPSPKQGV